MKDAELGVFGNDKQRALGEKMIISKVVHTMLEGVAQLIN